MVFCVFLRVFCVFFEGFLCFLRVFWGIYEGLSIEEEKISFYLIFSVLCQDLKFSVAMVAISKKYRKKIYIF
jgi:hypothetical protein